MFMLMLKCSNDATLELFRLLQHSMCGVFLALMAVGQQVRPESKSSWQLDCCLGLLPDEASPKHEASYITWVGMAYLGMPTHWWGP